MMRMLLLLKQAGHELVRIVHPNVVNPVVLGGEVVAPKVMQGVKIGAPEDPETQLGPVAMKPASSSARPLAASQVPPSR